MILLIAAVLLLSIFAEKLSDKLRLPVLIIFMALGMFFGEDGPLHIAFDDYELTEQVCSAALIFIMYYGGFNLSWKYAKKIWPQAVSLSTLGVLLTVLFGTLILCWLTGMSWITAFLICSVLGSTDAASVFNILKREKLNLKDNTASLLEMESGSNDPISYMLTFVAIQIYLTGQATNIVTDMILQIFFGLLWGVVCAWITKLLFSKTKLVTSELSAIAMIGMVLLCYGMSSFCSGNAYLSVYLMGVLVGNSRIPYKQELASFFDGITGIAQIVIFFILGLLSTPSSLISVLPISLLIFVVLLLAARPLACVILLKPFHASWRQIFLVSFAGLRGAASSVFAVMAVAAGCVLNPNLFQVVFLVTLLSVGIQGTFFAWVCRKLGMVDDKEDVRKTFNDFADESAITMMRVPIPATHPWNGMAIKDIPFQPGSLVLMVKRDKETLPANGSLVLQTDDVVIMSVKPYYTDGSEQLTELELDSSHPWVNRKIRDLDLSDDVLIALVQRGGRNIIPSGSTTLYDQDKVVLFEP